METYRVSCTKYAAHENWNVRKTNQNRLIFFSNCAICGKKKNKTFLKNKELHNFDYVKMNKIISKFLLAGEKCMWELHSKEPGFTYGACRSFTKHSEIIKKIEK